MEKTALEIEFEQLMAEHSAEIQAEADVAMKALDRAKALSEKYGLPLSIGLFSGVYTPKSSDRFRDEDWSYDYFGEYAGWSNSSSTC